MEKQFILVAQAKENPATAGLDLIVRGKLAADFGIQWLVVNHERQLYNFVIAPNKIARLKAVLDETGDYERLELFEYVAW